MVKTYVKNAAAIMAVATIASFGMMVSADSGYTHTRTLKVGSRGLAVESLQEALNSCWDAGLVADGIFGKGVKAAVKAAQMDLGVTADGIVGKISGGEISDCEPMDEVVEETTTTTTTTSTTLTGPEGNLSNIVKLGSYNNTKVSEGDKDIKVLGVEMIAKDGDQKVDGFNIGLYNSNGSSSKKLTKYASEISIWLDGKEIGRKLVSQYSDDASDIYTYRFSGMNGIIKKDMKSQLVVAISGTGSMDSTDATNEAWTVFVGGTTGGTDDNFISAMSANGRFRDYGTATVTSTVDFQKAGGVSSDQKFKVVTSSTNPTAQILQVSQTADTSDVTLLSMDIKAENGAMIIQKLPVTIATVDGTTDLVAPFTNAIVKSVKLYANGVKIADESVPQDGIDSVLETIIFGNSSKLAYKIAANATVKFEVKADLNDTENTGIPATDFDNGDKVAVSYTSTNLTNSTVELDNVNMDTVSNRSGSATGENQTLRSTGMQVTMGASTTEATPNNSGEILNRTIKIPVTVKAFDETVYLSPVAENVATPSGTQAIAFQFEDSTGAIKVISNSVTLTSNDATVESGAYRVDAGSTRTFMLTAVITGTTTHAQKQYRVQLQKINGYTNAALSTGQSLQDLTPVNSFESAFYTLNLN